MVACFYMEIVMEQKVKMSVMETLVVRLFSSWCLATVSMSELVNGGLYSFASIDQIVTSKLLFYILVNYVLLTVVDTISYRFLKQHGKIDIIVYIYAVMIFGLNAVYRNSDPYLACTIVIGLCFCMYYVVKKYGHIIEKKDINTKTVILVAAILAVVIFSFMSVLVILRYKTFYTSTFDFGVFAQMFYNMRDKLLPLTTCERNIELSHFAVHVSPIYYLVLPIYMIFPFNETLLIVQLLFIVSGVIPLILICRHRKLTNFITMAMAVIYLFSPVFFGGLFYDFHENKFLTTLILWLLYFIEKDKKIGMYIFTILVLMVKEDAGIYAACIGLYILATKNKKERIHGAIITALSVIWFLLAYSWLKNGGDGAMTGRYKNFIGDEDSVFAIIETIIKNPAYFFKQLLSVEKLEKVLWVIVPVMLMPFRVKSMKELILLIPFLVMNLMPSYIYQYDIAHQYYYGSFVLMLYLVIVNIDGVKGLAKISTVVCMMVASIIMFTSYVTVKFYYIDQYIENKDRNKEVVEILESIPQDASVCATTYYMTHLAMRDEIYGHPEGMDCEFIVYDLTRNDVRERYKKEAEELMEEGYRLYDKIEDVIIVLEKE